MKSALKQVRIEQETAGDIVVKIVYLSGKITALNGLEINHRLRNLFDDGLYNVFIDISDVNYMDSKGMAMLLTIAKSVEQNNGVLVLVKPSLFVKELLELTNLNTYFSIVDSMEEARLMLRK